jgi:transposase-like protein
MKKKPKRREFTAALKRRAVERMNQGECVSALAREYGVERSRLYGWRDQCAAGGLFPGGGRPAQHAVQPKVVANELDAAEARIAELERKVGQQEMALDFFRGALQQVNQSKSTCNGGGSIASSSTSERE